MKTIFDVWMDQQRQMNKTKELDWQKRFGRDIQPVRKESAADSDLLMKTKEAIRMSIGKLVMSGRLKIK